MPENVFATPPRPMAVGAIARQYSRSIAAVVYAIESRGIKEAYRAGQARVYSPEQVVHIGRALAETAQRSSPLRARSRASNTGATV
jgi:hypothetical protein